MAILAFWKWSKKLGDLIFWATNPDAKTTSRAGWRDAVAHDVQELSRIASDAAPDEITQNKVSRARSLAMNLVRMLHEETAINSTPCRDWSLTDQAVVRQLEELQSQFVTIGDGEHDKPGGTTAMIDGAREVPPRPNRPRNDEPTEADLLIGRQVLQEIATRNPAVEKFRAALRAKGLKGSNAKLGKVLDRLKAEKKMQK